jgi:AraC-like DNA-binding protein
VWSLYDKMLLYFEGNAKEVPELKILNYMELNRRQIRLIFDTNRTETFKEVYHAHQGMEWLYVHEGKGRAIIDRHIFELDSGTFLYFKPFQLHHVQMFTAANQPYIRSLFIFEPLVLENFLTSFPALNEVMQRMLLDRPENQIIRWLDREELDKLFTVHRKLLNDAKPSELLEQQALFLVSMLALMKTASRNSAKLSVPPASSSSTAEQIMSWVDKHYMEPFHLDKVSDLVHLSPAHVSSLFRKTVGTSITEYLTARRIREASLLLKKSSLTVQEIGEAVGLTNFSYFCQLFKKHAGLSPHQYRKLIPQSEDLLHDSESKSSADCSTS